MGWVISTSGGQLRLCGSDLVASMLMVEAPTPRSGPDRSRSGSESLQLTSNARSRINHRRSPDQNPCRCKRRALHARVRHPPRIWHDQSGEPGLLAFYGIVAWTALPAFALYFLRRSSRRTDPRGQAAVLGRGIRLCGLVGGPLYEDDFFRYLWGRLSIRNGRHTVRCSPRSPSSWTRLFRARSRLPWTRSTIRNYRRSTGRPRNCCSCSVTGSNPATSRHCRGLLIGCRSGDHRPTAAAGPGAQRPALRLVPLGRQGDRVHCAFRTALASVSSWPPSSS